MNERRAQWLKFFEAALAGASVDTEARFEAGPTAKCAAEIADEAMKRLDERAFSQTLVESLMDAANNVHTLGTAVKDGFFVPDYLMARLGKTLSDLRGDD